MSAFTFSFTSTLLPHPKTLRSPNRTSSFSVNPKTSSYTSPKATAKSSSSKQHNKPPRKPLLEPSFPEVILNACDDFIDTFINPPRHPSIDPKYVLTNNFAPVDELPPTECEVVKGSLPPCLDGAYIRNGSNTQYLPRGPFHLFDGDGMLHSTRISQGKAIFCSRYVKTYKYMVEKEAGFSIIPNLFSDFNSLMASVSRGAVSIARTNLGQFDPSNGIGLANTSLALLGGNLFALYETDLPYAIKLAPNGDIITIGRHDFDGNLSTNMTAHPKIDPNTSEAFAFSSGPIPPFLTFFRIDPNGTKSRGVPIFSMTRPSFVHDFAITKNYAIFPDIQIEMNPFKPIITGGSPVGFNSRKVPRLGVIPRYATNESEMKWFEVPGFNMVHAINAWEEDDGDTIIVIAPNLISAEHLSKMDLIHASIEKVKIDLKTGTVSRNPMSTRNLELAGINPTYVGKKNKYIYAAIGDPWPKAKGVVKLDVSISEIEHRDCIVATRIFGPNCFCSEPFFVEKDPNSVFAADEDDGYVVCYMHNESTREASFLVMDAKSHDLEIVAVVKLPRRVPYGFHGIFVKESDLNLL
ncbi:probable carotenoid cleavage dioxygenase 4, chloroplastic isoform X1 [Lycium ferocissimum]|uniref:probable carotenoid cleavage dioxygenase 4, chloroplastic isoform X1 n=1 Tax=Lycium ferocissimum TaxID=112874 RepID=UPI0028156C7A|nr:probable carotenoid cleavage dioxygenase 4, chloroplastic isoform X1 [Lycium ferocissimum]